MAYGVSNGHVTDDVTWPRRCYEAVRSAILATASLASCFVRLHPKHISSCCKNRLLMYHWNLWHSSGSNLRDPSIRPLQTGSLCCRQSRRDGGWSRQQQALLLSTIAMLRLCYTYGMRNLRFKYRDVRTVQNWSIRRRTSNVCVCKTVNRYRRQLALSYWYRTDADLYVQHWRNE